MPAGYSEAMEPWLIAVVLRPLGALVLFTAVAFVAYKVIGPLIPEGRIKAVLFDRGLRKRHPWKFFFLFAFCFYGTMGLVGWLVTR